MIIKPGTETPKIGIYQYITGNPSGIKDDKVICTDAITGKKLTYGEFKRNSKRFASGLIDKAGFKRGNVLAIVSLNKIDYPVVSFGTIAAGGKVIFINPKHTVEELAYQLNSKAGYIVSSPKCLPNVINAAAKANIPQRNIFLFDDKNDKGIQPYSSLMSEKEINPVEYLPEKVKSAIAYLCYSSDTTSRSKWVETTHFDMLANLSQMDVCEDSVNSDTTFVSVWPFFHIYGLNIFTHFALIKGASAVLMPEFDISAFCEIIQEHKVGVIIVTPSILSSLVENKISEGYNLSSIRLCICPAASLRKGLAEEFIKRFNAPVMQCRDLTEAVKVSDNHVLESVGRPASNVKCKVVSENEEGHDQPVELYARDTNIMKAN